MSSLPTRYKEHGSDTIGPPVHVSSAEALAIDREASLVASGHVPADLPTIVVDPPVDCYSPGFPGARALDGSWVYFYSSTMRRWGRVALQPTGEELMSIYSERISPKAPASASVSNSSITIVEANVNRRYLLICNESSDTAVYLGLNNPAVSGKGIRLNPGGSTFEVNYTNFYTGDVRAIAAAAGPVNVTIQEG